MPENCSDFITANDTEGRSSVKGAQKSPKRGQAPVATTLTGDIRYHRCFRSAFLPLDRDLIAYLPPGYESEPERRYPVLYMQDGQNLFDNATAFGGREWGLDETAQHLILEHRIEPLIIVGIYNTGESRVDEYTPAKDTRLNRGGKADLYGKFLLNEVKPFIDSRYRTLTNADHTGLGGSSLGGLLTLYLGLKYPAVFGRLLVMSPSVWWGNGMIIQHVRSLKAKPSTRIWLDIGAREGKLTPSYVRELRNQLLTTGWRSTDDLHFLEVEEGAHNEEAWGSRAGQALEYLFPVKKPALQQTDTVEQ